MSSSHTNTYTPNLLEGPSENNLELNGETTGAQLHVQRLHLELDTKKRIIDDLLQKLHDCMKEKSEREIQHEVLQAKLAQNQIEVEKGKKTSNWYKGQLYQAQKEVRSLTVAQRELRDVQEQQRIRLLKTLSENESLNERLLLEKTRRCNHDLPDVPQSPGYNSKDSGVFSESNVSDVSVDLSSSLEQPPSPSPTPQSLLPITSDYVSQLMQEQLKEQVAVWQQMVLQREKQMADCEMLQQQCQLQKTLLKVQEKNIDQLKEQLKCINTSLSSKTGECETALHYLSKCREQVDQLLMEKEATHKESMQMISRFERISVVINHYRTEIREKDEQIELLSNHRTVQRNTISMESKQVQTEPSVPSGIINNYHRNLLKVVERENHQKLQRKDKNMRTLLKKLKEEMANARKHEAKYQRLEKQLQLLLHALALPSSGLENNLEKDLELIIESCKEMAQLKDGKEAQPEELLIQVDTFKGLLQTKDDALKDSSAKIETLLQDQRSLHRSLDVLKSKFLAMEEELMDHANFKSNTENAQRQIERERDALLCQNKNSQALLRQLLLVQRPNSSTIATAKHTLKRCANYNLSHPLQPVTNGIAELRMEMNLLESAVLYRNEGQVSLLDELHATRQFQLPLRNL